jgi:hypothetical protein
MLDAGMPGKVGYRPSPSFFRHHAFRADPGTDHHGQHKEDSVRAFHRRPKRSRVIEVAREEVGPCWPQRHSGGRRWVAHQGADRSITFKQVPRGRAALLSGGADYQHWSPAIRHTSSSCHASGAWPYRQANEA